MVERINLQNSPLPEGIERRCVSFRSGSASLEGHLYLPREPDAAPTAVVVAGAWTSVKEQMSGTYARELARRGFISLAFDYAGWGQSGGHPRYVEDPARKIDDLHAAAAFLATYGGAARARLAGVGICVSGAYMATAVADNPQLQRLALVAPWFHNPRLATELYGGSEAVQTLVQTARAAVHGELPALIPAASTTDRSALMFDMPYYTEPERGLIATYDNRFNLASWEPWLTYDALATADRLHKPTLMVGSPAIALLAGAQAFENRMRTRPSKLWLDDTVTQFDFYDRRDAVTTAVDAIATFLD